MGLVAKTPRLDTEPTLLKSLENGIKSNFLETCPLPVNVLCFLFSGWHEIRQPSISSVNSVRKLQDKGEGCKCLIQNGKGKSIDGFDGFAVVLV